jgi:hypothetical protein
MARSCLRATVSFVLINVDSKMLYCTTLYFSSPLDGHFSLYTLNCSFNAYLLLLVLVMLVATLSCNFAGISAQSWTQDGGQCFVHQTPVALWSCFRFRSHSCFTFYPPRFTTHTHKSTRVLVFFVLRAKVSVLQCRPCVPCFFGGKWCNILKK